MRADILRWVLFYLFTGNNARPDLVKCEFGVAGKQPLTVTVPETSGYYANHTGLLNVLRELDANVYFNAGSYWLNDAKLPHEVLLELLPFNADVVQCHRCTFEYMIRVDL